MENHRRFEMLESKTIKSWQKCVIVWKKPSSKKVLLLNRAAGWSEH